MPEPLVSVVIPCRDRRDELPATLESILSQDYEPIEVIVADGASTDGTSALLRSYGSRIAWFSEPDHGPFDAINRGWARASGDILAWLNADDRWEPGAVRAAVEAFAAHPAASVVYGSACGIGPRGLRYEFPARPFVLEAALLHCDHVITQAASFVHRQAVAAAGGLFPAWTHDHELWLRIAMHGGVFVPLPRLMATVRLSPHDAHNDPARMTPARLAMLDRLLADPAFPTALRRRNARLRSNTWLRTLDSLRLAQPAHWYWGVRALTSAVASDPSNARHIAADVTRRVCQRFAAPQRFDPPTEATQTADRRGKQGEGR